MADPGETSGRMGGYVPEGLAERGDLHADLRDEFPGLGLSYVLVERGSGRSPSHVKERLKEISNRFTGGQAVVMRQKAIPWSYRVFFRHIGLDPDHTFTPIEALTLERMKKGHFRSDNLLDDALTIATVETHVGVRAFDADRLSGRLGIRPAEGGERLEGRPGELPPGTLVIADAERPVSLLFGAMAAGRGVHGKTKRTVLVAVQVKGVPDLAVEEALWLASEVMLSA